MTTNRDAKQEGLADHGEDLAADRPLVYLGVPLSQLPEERREKVELLAYAVNNAISEQTRGGLDPWPVRVHSPIKISAPWKEEDREPEDVYELNSGTVELEADAMIVIAEQGGSLGIGQELAWACAAGLPILVLHRKKKYVSRQLTGASSYFDISIEAYECPEQLRDVVCRWLVSRRNEICDGPRRRLGRKLVLTGRVERLARAWDSLGDEERRIVSITCGTTIARIERVLSDPRHLDLASVRELHTLEGALGIGVPEPAPRELREGQRRALSLAAREFDWDAEQVLRLDRLARRELARGGVRRLPLSSVQDWAEFSRRHEL
jgi:hypothetical protein